MVALVELVMRILTVFPCSTSGMGLIEHSSPPPALLFGSGVSVTAEDGNGRGVMVGRGVLVGVSVGGIEVAVGMAAWVPANIVRATAATVLCMSITLIVGGGGTFAPQALMVSVTISIRVRIEKRFM